MAAQYARNAYSSRQKVQPETNPKRLILMLYEGALSDLRLHKEAIEQHNARQRGEQSEPCRGDYFDPTHPPE